MVDEPLRALRAPQFFRGQIARRLCFAPTAVIRRVRAALAQLVEHRIRNAEVRCSSHLSGTSFENSLPGACCISKRQNRLPSRHTIIL
jgi:hypothetical protein